MRIFALSVMLICLPSFAHSLLNGFPDARFAGQGYWNDSEGNEGIYETYVEFNSDLMSVAYQWEDGGLEIHLGFLFQPDATFDVVYEGAIAGLGFCEGDECYYDVEVDGVLYSEGLKFLWDQGILLKSGRKEIAGSVAYWDEELYDLDAVPPGEPLPIPVPPSIEEEGAHDDQAWDDRAQQDWNHDARQQWDDRAQQDWSHDARQAWDDRAQQDWSHDARQQWDDRAQQDWSHDASQRWHEEAPWYESVREEWSEEQQWWNEGVSEEWSQEARQQWRDWVGQEWADQEEWHNELHESWQEYSHEQWNDAHQAWDHDHDHDFSNHERQHWSHDWHHDAAHHADHDWAHDHSQVAPH